LEQAAGPAMSVKIDRFDGEPWNETDILDLKDAWRAA
jgi:hypothetical protein